MNDFIIRSVLTRETSMNLISHCFYKVAKGSSTLKIILNSVNGCELNEVLFFCTVLEYFKDISIAVHTHAEGIMDETALMLYSAGTIRSIDSGSEFTRDNQIDCQSKFKHYGNHIKLNEIHTNDGNVIKLSTLFMTDKSISADIALKLGLSDFITNY